MNTYSVNLFTDLDEEVTIYIEAYNKAEAEEIAIGMLENGELDCEGQICAEVSAVLA